MSLIDDKNIDMAKKCCGSDKSCITRISRLKLLDKKNFIFYFGNEQRLIRKTLLLDGSVFLVIERTITDIFKRYCISS